MRWRPLITKLFGTPLLLAGICLLHQALISPRKSRLLALWELSQALSFLARGVTLTRTPMPQLLKMRGFGQWGDSFFAAVYEGAFQKEQTLCDSWRFAAKALPLHDSEREELIALGRAFGENAQDLGRKLDTCAERLRAEWQNAQREQKEREKTEGPIFLCGGLLLLILLI